MGKISKFLLPLIVFSIILTSGVCYGDETAIFISGKTNALIILDLSGSMNEDPTGNFCFTTGCSKREMAGQAIQQILDYNGDGTINQADQNALGVGIGYMRYYGSYADGQGILVRNDIGSSYSDIWSSVSYDTQYAAGGTPLASALSQAKTYLNSYQATGNQSRAQNFVILITDGQDTFACYGDGTETQYDMYTRRKATVAQAKALADAGYKVFVVGFGATMPMELQNTLNWSAYYGGTDNPGQNNAGDTNAITPSANPCGEPSTNDPGMAALSGYAFLATSAGDLNNALRQIFAMIRYSFSVTSVSATRVAAENYIYQASFTPSNNDPFWQGHLNKYSINADGTVGSMVWDAGAVLQAKGAYARNILTYLGGSMTKFTSPQQGGLDWGQWVNYLGVDTNTAQAVVGYFQGDPAYNPDNWKLGDIFHSNPITIGSPSAYFTDIRSPQAFIDFRSSHTARNRIVVVGANDGQFRAFSGNDGSEQWSFLPPNLLPKLQYLAHSSNSGALPFHTYFVDGPVTAADVWLGSGNGTGKNPSDWHTMLIFSEGRGVRDSTNTSASYLWSASQYCDGNFNYQYTSAYKYYCGYWAFDVTDTSATTPALIWPTPINPDMTQGPYLGEPWSKMAIGPVKIGGSETWVGFIGGGYNSNSGDSNQGRGFFVVRLSDGKILWSYTQGNDANMNYSLPASPAILDTDNDGFVDTAYIGDLGGNIWRFKFCTGADGTACNTSNWSGGKFFQASTPTPIYTTPSMAMGSGSLWVFWGTGDKENPTATGTQDRFFAVKDPDRSMTYALPQLQDITGSIFADGYPGWYINLGTGEKVLADSSAFGGMITWTTYIPNSNPDPCNQVGTSKIYAIALMPLAISGVTYQVGAGLFAATGGMEPGTRAIDLGAGIAQAVVFSQKPGGASPSDAYITTGGGSGVNASIVSSAALVNSPFTQRLQATAPSAQLLHWWDQRVSVKP